MTLLFALLGISFPRLVVGAYGAGMREFDQRRIVPRDSAGQFADVRFTLSNQLIAYGQVTLLWPMGIFQLRGLISD
jgi:hypothetical protein